MCRFVLYLGPRLRISKLLTEPVNSLIHQSTHSQERKEPLNGDGFGFAWYAPDIGPEPAVFRAITPAWNNRNLLDLARIVESPCIMAHVRAATQGLSVMESNCHPFRSGHLLCMHNGDVGGFSMVRRPLMERLSDQAFAGIEGSTDSEHVFALFQDHLRERTEGDPVEAMAAALEETLRQVTGLVKQYGNGAPCYLNFAISDGSHAVACRCTTDPDGAAETLHLHRGKRYVCEDGVCRMVTPEHDLGTVIVSSEILSNDPGWETIPVNQIVSIGRDGRTELHPCHLE